MFEPVIEKLRTIAQESGLKEEIKWKQPCFSLEGANIVILGEFKAFCVMSFFKGALMRDNEGVLEMIGEHQQATRVIKFTTVQEVEAMESLLKDYIAEAIAIEQSGQKIEYKKVEEYERPAELEMMFGEIPELRTAFEALTPGRQKGYLLHFNGAKQSATKLSRIEKAMDRIFANKGLEDCICGRSKRMPRCDGTHAKTLE